MQGAISRHGARFGGCSSRATAPPTECAPRRGRTCRKPALSLTIPVSASPIPTRTPNGWRFSILGGAVRRSKASYLTSWSTGRATLPVPRSRPVVAPSRPIFTRLAGLYTLGAVVVWLRAHKKTVAPLWLRRSRWCIICYTRDPDGASIGESGGCTVGAVSRHFFG